MYTAVVNRESTNDGHADSNREATNYARPSGTSTSTLKYADIPHNREIQTQQISDHFPGSPWDGIRIYAGRAIGHHSRQESNPGEPSRGLSLDRSHSSLAAT